MFNRKKREIERLNAALMEKRNDFLKSTRECEFYRKQADALRTERDELLDANGQIKHDLETESRQKEDLAATINQFADTKEKHNCDQQGQDGDPGDG